jgi:hypothetical protein
MHKQLLSSKFFKSILLAMALPIMSQAQITITDQDIFKMIGTVVEAEVDTIGSVTVDIGSAGPNQTWDFMSLTLNGFKLPIEYIVPANTPFELDFPSANFVQKSTFSEQGFNGNIYTYHKVSNNEFEHLGNGIQVGDLTFLQPGGAEDVPLPLTYETTWTISTAETLSSFPGFYTIEKINADYSVDGWGRLKIPTGDFQTLRVKENYSGVTENYVANVLISTKTTQTISYTWIGQSTTILLRITSSNGETDPDFNTASEVWRISGITPSTVDDLSADITPLDFDLNQNYPNPFNPETIISYSLPRKSDVTISIYDITGRLIDNISPGLQSAGTHEIRLQAAHHLASGAYMYRIQAGDFVSTKKMILLR